MVVDPHAAEVQSRGDPHRRPTSRSRPRRQAVVAVVRPGSACSSSPPRCTETTGPKTSCWTISESCAAPATTVGSTKKPRSPAARAARDDLRAGLARRARRSRARARAARRDDRAELDVVGAQGSPMRSDAAAGERRRPASSWTPGVAMHAAARGAVLAGVEERRPPAGRRPRPRRRRRRARRPAPCRRAPGARGRACRRPPAAIALPVPTEPVSDTMRDAGSADDRGPHGLALAGDHVEHAGGQHLERELGRAGSWSAGSARTA